MPRGETTKTLLLTRDKIDAIVARIAKGSTIKLACLSNGVARSTFYDSIEHGEIDLKEGISDSLDSYLVQQLSKVRSHEIESCREDIRHNEKGHKGAEWTLEHAYSDEFSGSAAINALNEKLDRLLLTKNKLLMDEINGQEEKTL